MATAPWSLPAGENTYEGGTYVFTDKNYFSAESNAHVTFVGATFTGSCSKSLFRLNGAENVILTFVDCVFDGINANANSGNDYGFARLQKGEYVYFEGCTFRNITSKKSFIGLEAGETEISFNNCVIEASVTVNSGSIIYFDSGKAMDSRLSFEDTSFLTTTNILIGEGHTAQCYGDVHIAGNVSGGGYIGINQDCNVTIDGSLTNVLIANEGAEDFTVTVQGQDWTGDVQPTQSPFIIENPNRVYQDKTFETIAGTNSIVVFGSSYTSTDSVTSSFVNGTYTADQRHLIDGERHSVTLNGDYYTQDYRTYISRVTFNGKLYGGNNFMRVTDVSMPTSGRIYGAGLNNSTNKDVEMKFVTHQDTTNNQGVIYGGGLANGGNVSLNDISLVFEDIKGTSTVAEGTVTNVNGGTYGFIYSGANVTTANSFTANAVTLDINGGNYTKTVGNGSLVSSGITGQSITTTQGASTLKIADGVFDGMVYAGAYTNGNTAVVNSGITVEISGGTFNNYVVGGNLGKTTATAANAVLNGDISFTVDASGKAIHFAKGIVVGNRGAGALNGSTTLTFKGDKAVTFGTGAYIMGGNSLYSAADKTTWGGTGNLGDSMLVFENFSGSLAAGINESFKTITVNCSSVSLTGAEATLKLVDTWNFVIGENQGGMLAFGTKGACDFAGDTLNLSFVDGASISGPLDVIDFGTGMKVTNLDDLTVKMNSTWTHTEGSNIWAGDGLQLTYADNKLTLSQLA